MTVTRHHLRLLEALLFTAAEPLHEADLARRLPEDADLAALLAALTNDYASRGINLVRAGTTWAFATAPDLASALTSGAPVEKKLSRAALETLAIIAYHQPVTRPEIENIRGVQVSKGTMDVLLDQGWIAPAGRKQVPGRPLTWLTTEDFLRQFGLASLDDLPGIEEMNAAGLLDARPAIQTYHEDSASDDEGGAASVQR